MDAGPTGRLAARNAIPTPPAASRRILLLPGFTIEVGEDGNLLPGLDATLTAALRTRPEVLRPATSNGGSCLLYPGEGPGELLCAGRKARRGRPRPTTTERELAATMLAGRPGSARLRGTATTKNGSTTGTRPLGGGSTLSGGGGTRPQPSSPSGCPYRISYRDQSFEIECGPWLLDYLLDALTVMAHGDDAGYGKVSSADDALDALWGPFRDAAVGEPSDYDALLGCYNLHRQTRERWNELYPYFFWTSGWGAPLQAHRFTMQLVRTYADYADTNNVREYGYFGPFGDVSADFGACDGFVPFLKGLLDGREMERSAAADPVDTAADTCSLRINYRNAEEYPAVGPVCPEDVAQNCAGGMIQAAGKECDGAKWWGWTPRWNSDYQCYGGVDKDRCENMETACDSNGWGGDWEVTTAPIRLSFYGFVADRIMFTARMARDRSIDMLLDGGDWSEWEEAYALYETSKRIAAYAMRLFVEQGNLMVHEIGHSWLGGGHCARRKNCCFSVASNAWSCRVRAHLGLPRRAYRARESGDFDNPDGLERDDCRGCSSDGGVSKYFGFACDIPTEGVRDESATVYARTCWPPRQALMRCGALPW